MEVEATYESQFEIRTEPQSWYCRDFLFPTLHGMHERTYLI